MRSRWPPSPSYSVTGDEGGSVQTHRHVTVVSIGHASQRVNRYLGLHVPITKATLEMLAPQLAPELARHGITINALDPGPTDTGWMTEELKEQLKKQSKR